MYMMWEFGYNLKMQFWQLYFLTTKISLNIRAFKDKCQISGTRPFKRIVAAVNAFVRAKDN